jgi:hypothetical protein
METALEICRRGAAVAYLPTFIVHLHNLRVLDKFHLCSLPLPKNLPIQKQSVYLIKRKSDVEDDQFKKVARALRQI